MPFDNILITSKGSLNQLVSPVRDCLGELEAYWKTNEVISDSSIIIYALDEFDVKTQEVAKPRAFFDRMRCTKELASVCQGKLEITFSGYDDEVLFEIPEVRKYIVMLDKALPDLCFFARSTQPTYTLMTFALCQTSVEWPDGRSTKHVTRQVAFDPLPVAAFLERHCPGLNELTEWIGMPRAEEKQLFFDVVRCLGLPVPSGESVA